MHLPDGEWQKMRDHEKKETAEMVKKYAAMVEQRKVRQALLQSYISICGVQLTASHPQEVYNVPSIYSAPSASISFMDIPFR